MRARSGFKFVAVESHVKQHISLPTFDYLDEAENWVKKKECIIEEAGYYTYEIYEVRIVKRKRNNDESRSAKAGEHV